jgi:hypothetical protein
VNGRVVPRRPLATLHERGAGGLRLLNRSCSLVFGAVVCMFQAAGGNGERDGELYRALARCNPSGSGQHFVRLTRCKEATLACTCATNSCCLRWSAARTGSLLMEHMCARTPACIRSADVALWIGSFQTSADT